MSDNFVLEMCEAQAGSIAREQEPSETKQELKKIRKKHEKLANQMVDNNLMKIGEK